MLSSPNRNSTADIASETDKAPVWSTLTARTRLWFWAVLGLTAAFSLVWSHVRDFWGDELLEFYTDTKPTAGAIVWGQLHAPFSLEPPAFHLLLHFMHRLLANDPLALRLPSMLALLVTEGCVFFLALKVSGRQGTAVAAMVLPFVLVTINYAPEARVYGLLTACMAVALLCWQRGTEKTGNRAAALAGLTLALGAAILLHYFGLLVAVPLWAGEAVRTAQRRRFDPGVLAALLTGTLFLLLDLPFQRALAPFRLHYYDNGETHWRMIAFTYGWFVEHFTFYQRRLRSMQVREAGYLLLLLSVTLYVTRQMIRRWQQSPVWLEAALVASMLLPFLSLAVAHLSRAYSPRYSLPAVVGLSVIFPVAFSGVPWLGRGLELVALVLLVCGCADCIGYIRADDQLKRTRRQDLQLSPAVVQALRDDPDHHIYMQDTARFLVVHYYASGDLQAALRGVYDAHCELKWRHRDPASLFSRNMAETAHLPTVPFRDLYAHPEPRLMVMYHDPNEEWIEAELSADGAQVVPLGPALGGDLYRVTLPAHVLCEAPGES